ncbi:MAG: DUF262 domain-containing protein [Gammaproteobacteria bacterium]|nr:MAG: DUF262 domain-containing protein [Gammaproteobacteria bacterium]
MSFQTPITIKEAVDNIENNQYLLPAIQREFVWEHSKIEWLFDSIMRNYPISSFLFWQVEGETKKGYRFYKFINEYRENYKTHNSEISTDGIHDFKAILDGQQRLTSIYLGLKGSYAYKQYRRKWEDSEWSIPTRHLYLNASNELKNEEDGRVYEFKFLKKDTTKEQDIYIDKKDTTWFKIGKILELQNLSTFNRFIREYKFDDFAIDTLSRLQEVIHSDRLINYFLEKEQDLDKALNIFIRINSGGEPLNFSDLIMSIAVANWKDTDARQAIHNLVDNIRDKEFSTSKDFVLKVFLYLHSKDIKFKVKNFSNDNAKDFETRWNTIRDTILEVFNLVKTFGFTDFSLTSKNALIPIIYYVYHRNIHENFSTKKVYEKDRDVIKNWLHTMLIKKVFGSSADTLLSQIRNAFTDDFNTTKIKECIDIFPKDSILSKIKKDTSVSDDFIKELLSTQKDNKYAFSILSLLYPNLDYKNNNFHKDHLHPFSYFKKANLKKLGIENDDNNLYYHNPSMYNGIYNLQMLDANENMSKNDTELDEWVKKETKAKNKTQFLDSHLIPDTDLSFSSFHDFVDKREKILIEKLKNILK